MNTLRCFLKFMVPSLVVMSIVILFMHERHVEAISDLRRVIQEQGLLVNKLERENDSLRKMVEKLKEDKFKYINLEVTGVSHRDGGVVVNKIVCVSSMLAPFEFSNNSLSLLVSVFSLIVGMSYPLLLQAIQAIDEQYHSPRLSNMLLQERKFKCFRSLHWNVCVVK